VGSRASKVSEPSPKAPEPAPVASVEAPAKKELSAASRAFADAMDALARGDDELAADRFGTFSRSFASDPRADEADYLRAVALQRAGHAGDAKAASKKYLEARPNGAHRGDAKTLSGP
jgi:TolA-binding protein